MKSRIVTSFILVSIFCTGNLFAQKDSTKHHHHEHLLSLKTRAKEYFFLERFPQALQTYKKLDSIIPNNPIYEYHIGVCMLELEKTEALKWMKKCRQSNQEFPHVYKYYLGAAFHLNHKLDSAKYYYRQYMEHLYTDPTLRHEHALIHELEREIEMCNTGKKLMLNSPGFQIENLSDQINSQYADYAPLLTADEKTIIFTSERPNTTGGHFNQSDLTYNDDVYISQKQDNGSWSTPIQLGGVINSKGQDACTYLSPDGQKMILYRYGKDHTIGFASGNLYICTSEGGKWVGLEKLPHQINSHHHEKGGSLTSDERTMYFTSSRKGGYGGMDIYSIKRLPNGTWAGQPQNLGMTINTEHDEISPFIHPDGKTLYFCSDGHETMGGFDIFVSTLNETTGKWSQPVNIGYPINTAHDDINFYLSADGTRIYFSSIRQDTHGDKDIYVANLKKETAQLVVMTGLVLDSLTNTPIEAKITVKDKQTNEILGIYNSNKKNGKYVVIFKQGKKYNIEIEADGYTACYDYINGSNLKSYQEVDKNILLCPTNTSSNSKKKKKKNNSKSKK